MSTLQSFDEIQVETPKEKQARLNRLEIAELKSKLAATDYTISALKSARGRQAVKNTQTSWLSVRFGGLESTNWRANK